jgi:hypothetical protein
MQTSSQLWLNSINSKQAELKQAVSEFLANVTGENAKQKEDCAQMARQRVHEIRSLLAPGDVPSWLQTAINIFNAPRPNYPINQLLRDLIPLIALINSFVWSSSSFDENTGIDFDQIYAKHKAENKIESLFDNIIDAIQKMIDSNSIDSVKILRALEHLIATLKRSKAGSYLSMMAGWDFLQSLFRNWIFEQIKSVPVLGPIISALQVTMAEMDSALDQMHQNMSKEVQANYNTKVPMLTYTRFGLSKETPSISTNEATV